MSVSYPQGMKAKGFTKKKADNADFQKQVQRLAGCKETREAALQVVLEAAAHLTVHTTTNVPPQLTTQSAPCLTIAQTALLRSVRARESMHQQPS